jgi:cytosine/adenosine deaminase-related metal-dependent hydrolase
VTTRLTAAFVVGFQNGDHVVYRDGEVVFDGGHIVFVGRGYGGPVDRTIDAGEAIVSPGFIDLDALADIDHALIDSWHGPETRDGLEWSEDYFHHRRRDVFPPDEVAFKREFALSQLIRNGITTAMPISAETHNLWAETYDDMAATVAIAARLGIRLYVGPAYRSGVNVTRTDGTRDVLWNEPLGREGLADAIRFFRDFDGSHGGLIHGCLLPCRIETVTPELMRATAAAAAELDCLVRLHCLQGNVELMLLRKWYGKGPIEVLDEAGLLGSRLLIPHAIYIGGHSRSPAAPADELGRLAERGVTVIHCPMTSFRYGTALESFDRYRRAGINIALGTDSFPPDMIRNMDVGNHVAQLVEGRADAGSAADMFRAATIGGATALRRDDLGRLAPGACADMIVVDLNDPRVGPVDDPIRTLLLNTTGANVRTVIIDGRMVMEDWRIPSIDAAEMRRHAQVYFNTMKAAYAERDVRRRLPDDLFPASFRAA